MVHQSNGLSKILKKNPNNTYAFWIYWCHLCHHIQVSYSSFSCWAPHSAVAGQGSCYSTTLTTVQQRLSNTQNCMNTVLTLAWPSPIFQAPSDPQSPASCHKVPCMHSCHRPLGLLLYAPLQTTQAVVHKQKSCRKGRKHTKIDVSQQTPTNLATDMSQTICLVLASEYCKHNLIGWHACMLSLSAQV